MYWIKGFYHLAHYSQSFYQNLLYAHVLEIYIEDAPQIILISRMMPTISLSFPRIEQIWFTTGSIC